MFSFFRKLEKWIVPIRIVSFVIFGILAALFVRNLLNVKGAVAGWYNDSWAFRQTVNFNNSSGSTQTNYQSPITLNTSALISAGKMQTDCDDIRITDLNGGLLSYWLSGCNTATTAIWPRLPSIPTAGTKVYLYYGNPSATAGRTKTGTASYPGLSCKTILDAGDSSGSGNYYIDPTNGDFSDQFQAYCDMTNDSGGWILATNSMIQSEVNTNITASKTTGANGGLTISLITTGATGCGTTHAYKVYFNDIVPWTKIKADYEFYGGNSCWSIFGNASFSSDGNITPFTAATDTIRNQVKMGGSAGDNYDGINTRCDNETTNFWHSLQGNVTRSAQVILRRNSMGSYAGLATGTECTNDQNGWKYSNIYLKETSMAPTNISADSPSNEERGPGPMTNWSFNEGFGDTIHDGSSGTYNGTRSGSTKPTWQSEEACISGKCLYYDGNSSYMSIPSMSDPNIFGGTTGSWTLSLWIKPNDLGNNYRTVFRRLSGMHYLAFNPGNKTLQVMVWNGVGSQNAWYNTIAAIQTNVWTHVVVQLKGGEGMKFYINGKLDNNISDTNLRLTDYGSDTGLGADLGGYQYYKGFIDEVAVYPYQLSSAKITQLYNTGKSHQGSVKGTAVSAGGGNDSADSLSNGLVGYWKMDEESWNGTAGEIKDASGIGNNLAAVSGANVSGGKYGNAGSFNGSNSYAALASTAYESSQGRTGCAWVKPTAHTNALAAVFRKTNDFSLRLDTDGKFIDRVWNSSGSTSSAYYSQTGIPTGSWSHVCVTWESPGPNQNIILRYYINGKMDLDQKTDLTDSGGLVGQNVGSPLRIGSDPDIASRIFNGRIDEVRLYNRALSPAEIAKLYDWAPTPIAHWKMDENDGQYLYDSSGGNNTVTLGNNSSAGSDDPAWSAGKYGSSLKFDGSDDFAFISNPSFDDFGTTGEFTAETWFKSTTLNGQPEMQIIDNKYAGTNSGGFNLQYYPGSPPYIYFRIGNGSAQTGLTASANYLDGKWHHVAAVFARGSANDSMYIYIDGVLANQTSSLTAGWNITSSTPMYIGDYTNGSGDARWNGGLDDIRIYNYPRTAKQIVQDMNAGHPAGGSPVASQQLYWKFDEGYGATVHDSSGHGYDGTLGVINGGTTPTWKKDGKFDNALYFNSVTNSNGFVCTAYGTTINVSSTAGSKITFSSWVKPDASQPNTGTIVRNGIGTDQNYAIQLYQISSNNFRVTLSGYDGASWIEISTTGYYVPAGQWSQVTVVYSQDEWMKVYVNGAFKEQVTWPYNPTVQGTSQFCVGGHSGSYNQWLKGYIDEVKVYNYELSADDVKIDYNRGASMVLGALGTSASYEKGAANQKYCVPGDSATCAPPASEWEFNENTGSTTYDTSSSGYAATITTPFWVNGKNGSALDFSTNTSVVAYYYPYTIYNMTDFTTEVWIKVTGDNVGGLSAFITTLGVSNVSTKATLLTTSQQARCYVDYDGAANADSTSSLSLTKNVWHHIACIHKGSSDKKSYIYVDGVETGYATQTAGIGNIVAEGANPIAIGNTTDLMRGFPGQIDSVKIYNYNRSPSQIAYDYNRGRPVAQYNIDECEGTTIHSNNENYSSALNGTINANGNTQTSAGTCTTSGTMWGNGAAGKYNASLNFDGQDDNVTIPITASNGLNIYGAVSFAAWFKRANTGTYQTIVSDITSCSNPLDGFLIRFTESNSIYFQGYKADISNSNVFNAGYTSSTLWNDTTNWHHVVGTWDGTTNSNGVKLYVDGVLVGQGTSTAANFNSLAGINQMIGSLNCNAHYFAGKIDDVRIYDYAVTPEQVKDIYNSGAVSFK